jgi:hypothetical protein
MKQCQADGVSPGIFVHRPESKAKLAMDILYKYNAGHMAPVACAEVKPPGYYGLIPTQVLAKMK